MTDKLKHIFEESDCPDKATLFSYVAGTLSPSKEHSVEEHLVDCAFCSEAIESFRSEKDPYEIQERIAEMETRILRGDTGKNRGGTSFQKYFLGYAAVLVLLLVSLGGLYFLLSENKDGNLVMEAPVSRQAPSVQKQEGSKQIPPSPARAVNSSESREKAKQGLLLSDEERMLSGDTENESDLQNVDVRFRASSDEAKESKEVGAASAKVVNQKNPAAPKQVESLAKLKEEGPASTNEVREFSRTTSLDSPSAANSDSRLLYATKTEAGKREAKKTISILDSAVDAFENRFYIRTVNLLLNYPAKDKREAAKADWYLASAYVQTREFEKARPILEGLASGSSSYSRKARKLLETIN